MSNVSAKDLFIFSNHKSETSYKSKSNDTNSKKQIKSTEKQDFQTVITVLFILLAIILYLLNRQKPSTQTNQTVKNYKKISKKVKNTQKISKTFHKLYVQTIVRLISITISHSSKFHNCSDYYLLAQEKKRFSAQFNPDKILKTILLPNLKNIKTINEQYCKQLQSLIPKSYYENCGYKHFPIEIIHFVMCHLIGDYQTLYKFCCNMDKFIFIVTSNNKVSKLDGFAVMSFAATQQINKLALQLLPKIPAIQKITSAFSNREFISENIRDIYGSYKIKIKQEIKICRKKEVIWKQEIEFQNLIEQEKIFLQEVITNYCWEKDSLIVPNTISKSLQMHYKNNDDICFARSDGIRIRNIKELNSLVHTIERTDIII